MPLFEAHRATLDGALDALAKRGYWIAYPETLSGKIYGETANAEAKARFEAQMNKPFELDQPGPARVGGERSPYGFELGITYPKPDVDKLVSCGAGRRCRPGARRGSRRGRRVPGDPATGINRASFEIALRGHAHDRPGLHDGVPGRRAARAGPRAGGGGLRLCGDDAHARHGALGKAAGQERSDPARQDVHDGAARHRRWSSAASTFPTWNSYPGAVRRSWSPATPVVVKPHPARDPAAGASPCEIAREVLKEAGFDPNVMQLAADDRRAPIAQELATRPEVAIIDYTGSPAFGDWLEKNARQAQCLHREGRRQLRSSSTPRTTSRAWCGNLAFSLSLYSGQMCTTPQNIFVPRGGIATECGHMSLRRSRRGHRRRGRQAARRSGARGRGAGRDPEQGDARRASTRRRGRARSCCASQALQHPQFPDATVRTPIMVRLDAAREDVYMQEMFGPDRLPDRDRRHRRTPSRARPRAAKVKGAITAAVYSTDAQVIDGGRGCRGRCRRVAVAAT